MAGAKTYLIRSCLDGFFGAALGAMTTRVAKVRILEDSECQLDEIGILRGCTHVLIELR
jgi:hypothetical protein